MFKSKKILLPVVAATALGAGIVLDRVVLSGSSGDGDGPKILYWVAPMDPNFRRDGPGKSPMGMDLVPVYEGDEPSGDPGEVSLSPEEINAIGVRTAVARMEPISRRIDTVGFVSYNEHETSHIHMRVNGWIEDLRVRAVGDKVKKGDLLFEIYAPDISIAANELSRANARGHAVEARIARLKLRNFGMTPRQISELARSGSTTRTVKVYAPRDGVVISMEAADGMYLKPETRAVSLTDLSSVWLIVDIFERDIGRLASAGKAIARFEHLPGQAFEGKIDYIYPELDPKSRTLPVRLRFDNSAGLLRPNMFGSVSLIPKAERKAITVPSEAVIRTGRAERVVLKVGEGRFKPRLVTTGLRDGFGDDSRTEIVQGLRPGEEVVSSAQFLIDSESALNAGFLRMAPTRSEPASGSGVLVSLDEQNHQAVIRHEALPALDWPAMETGFSLLADIKTAGLKPGDEVKFSAFRGTDGQLALLDLGTNDGIDATGTGTILAVTEDGKLTLSHDPVPALGWPAMKMDLPVSGFDPHSAPLNRPIHFDLAKGEGGMFLIVGVHDADGGSVTGAPATETKPAKSATAPPLTAEGSINSVNPEKRIVNATHGPLMGMPGMTMDFPLADGVDPASIAEGPGTLVFSRSPEGALLLAEVRTGEAEGSSGPSLPPRKPEPPQTEEQEQPPLLETGGTVNAIDAAKGTASITHGPLMGMPGMTMVFPLAPDLDPETVPIGKKITVLFRKGADFSLTFAGFRAGDAK